MVVEEVVVEVVQWKHTLWEAQEEMTGNLNLLEHPVKQEEKSFERHRWEEKQILKSALPPSVAPLDDRRKYPAVCHSDLRRQISRLGYNSTKKCNAWNKKGFKS